MNKIRVYNQSMQLVALLENATDIGYATPFNGLWTANFSLPANDEKNAECLPLRFVEIFDGDERLDLFRILPNTARRSADGSLIMYQCEHVLATLLDDVMFQYHTIGNLGTYTAAVLQYVLSKQTTARWQLGTVGFSRQFEYNWENENLLAALFSVPKPFVEDYQWTWDTSSYPWTLNLVEPPTVVEAYIRYGVNMRGIEKTTDPSNLCTRLYGLGYGEGVNQLKFSDINGGLPYIDADTQGQYGIVSRIFVDRRFEFPETLLARCQAILEELKTPRISYAVDAAELFALTKEPIDRFQSGKMVRVQDGELGIDVTARVVNVSKSNVFGAPGDVQIEIANRPQDIASSIADLANRQRIQEVYAQGATNLDSHDFADNCDPTHPAVMRFYVPEETARINKVQLSYQVEAFRVPVKGAAAGGGTSQTTSSGGGTTQTTTSGGGTTATSSSGGAYTNTTASGGGDTSGPSSTSTTAGGGGETLSFASRGSIDYTSFAPSFIRFAGTHNHGQTSWTIPTQDPDHVHQVYDGGEHTHTINDFSMFTEDHTHDMPHTHSVPAHVHGLNIPSHVHDVTIPNHSHGVTIPDHSHGVTIPNHTHDMVYGIFEGPTPTGLSVTVDGNVVPGLGTSVTDIDIIPYLSKDGAGKVVRGWHEIKITPNTLGRIVSNVNLQLFVQSRGGGNY